MGQRGLSGPKWGGGKVTLLQSIETKRFNWEICPPGVTITQGGAFFVVKNLRSPKKFQKISESSKKFRKKSCPNVEKKVVIILKKSCPNFEKKVVLILKKKLS